MAYTLAELQTDIRGYTEVDSNVFTELTLIKTDIMQRLH